MHMTDKTSITTFSIARRLYFDHTRSDNCLVPSRKRTCSFSHTAGVL